MSDRNGNGAIGSAPVPGGQPILERPRINALLEKALDSLAVFITAGEGYGKTFAVHTFLRQKGKKAIWISMSEKDNDPLHFWGSVVKAVAPFDAAMAKALEEIGFPETPEQIKGCLSVLAEGADTERAKNVVAVDNCHLINEEAILNTVNQILVFPFPRETTIMISRTEPKLNTMTLLSKGLMYRISADELRFNEKETGEYFRLCGADVSMEEAARICADTGGWALALRLIAEEMKSGSKKYSRSLLEHGELRALEDSFFASLPAPLGRFLIVLSLFDQWPREAVEKMTAVLPGLPPIEELTETLTCGGALISYDSYLHGFRIAKLFLDYLRERQKELSPKEVKTAGAIAAAWCMENRFWIEAAHNFGMAEDFEGLLKAIYSYPRLISRPVALSFRKILDGVLNGNERHEDDRHFLFLRHVTRAGLLLNLGQYSESVAALKESIRKFEAQGQGRENSRILSACYSALGAITIVTCHITRDMSETLHYFERSHHYYTQLPSSVSGPRARPAISSYANFIGHPPKPGEYEEYIGIITKCIPHASASTGGYLSGIDSLCWAEFAFFSGDLDAAEQRAREAVFKARKKRQYETESKSLFYLLRIHLINGNISAYLETWEQMEAQLSIPDYFNRYAIHDIITGWFYAHYGETELVIPWLKAQSEESGLNLLFHNYELMVKAKYLFAEKKFRETLDLLGQKDVGEGLGAFHLGMLEIYALEAAAYSRIGNVKSAQETLETAYEMSKYHSVNYASGCKGLCLITFDMPFIELGEDMRAMADSALNGQDAERRCGIPRPWLENIRNKASVYGKKLISARERHKSRYGNAELPFLTIQERTILAGISRGLTREEIAGNCSLSVNTIKSTIRNIYEKLGAFNRADAIRIATEAGILNQ